MNLKEYYKNCLLNIIFEQNDDIDTELKQEVESLGKIQAAVDKERSQSSTSGISALNDNRPLRGSPSDYLRRHNSLADKAKAVRLSMSATEKLADPIGLKALGIASNIMQGQNQNEPMPIFPSGKEVLRKYDDVIDNKHKRIGELKNEKESGRIRNKNTDHQQKYPDQSDQLPIA